MLWALMSKYYKKFFVFLENVHNYLKNPPQAMLGCLDFFHVWLNKAAGTADSVISPNKLAA